MAAAVITGPMAKPSRPSVRFTALEVPTTTNTAKGTYQMPKSGCTFLKKGTATVLLKSGCSSSTTVAAPATAICGRSLLHMPSPRLLLRRTLRMSSTKPMAANPTVTARATSTYTLVTSPTSTVDSTSDSTIRVPPMVGVPALEA